MSISRQAGELSIVGDFDPKTAIPILAEMLSGWKGERPYSRIVMSVPSGLKGTTNKINTPDKANAVYRAGLLFSMHNDDLDYPAASPWPITFSARIPSCPVWEHACGRTKVYRTAQARRSRSRRSINGLRSRSSAIANPQNITKVDQGMREELDRLLTNPPSQEELDGAKQGYLRLLKVPPSRRCRDWQAYFPT